MFYKVGIRSEISPKSPVYARIKSPFCRQISIPVRHLHPRFLLYIFYHDDIVRQFAEIHCGKSFFNEKTLLLEDLNLEFK